MPAADRPVWHCHRCTVRVGAGHVLGNRWEPGGGRGTSTLVGVVDCGIPTPGPHDGVAARTPTPSLLDAPFARCHHRARLSLGTVADGGGTCDLPFSVRWRRTTTRGGGSGSAGPSSGRCWECCC